MRALCWHPFHEMYFPIGYVDVKERRWQIDFVKAPYESAEMIELRKKLFQPVTGTLTCKDELILAAQKVWDGIAALGIGELSSAMSNWKTTYAIHLPEIMALHATECGCPWTPKNNNIFSQIKMPSDRYKRQQWRLNT